MSPEVQGQFDEAVRAREAGLLNRAQSLLEPLIAHAPDDAMINYQMAWTLDRMGLETEAVPYYERAIASGNDEYILRGALLGLGSTYRVIGRDAEAVRTLAAGVARFPDDGAMRTFYALALHSAGAHTQATQEFLRVIIEASANPRIERFRRPLTLYMEHPDELWLNGAWHERP